MSPHQRLVVLGVAASDVHVVANKLIEMHLRANGLTVVNLGVCTPLREFAAAVRANPQAEAVIIGSLNGHAYEDLQELPALRASGRLTCPVVLGGNLSVGSGKAHDEAAPFYALGVDRVLRDAAELLPALDGLRAEREAATAADRSLRSLAVPA
ncbi:cobalamin-dependent protein [Streptomyces sp.]|uniref:cobalamin-dependent protein n=1 Tax=Streptomyces sp. TaxID=1931 RepID=UPI002F3E3BA8